MTAIHHETMRVFQGYQTKSPPITGVIYCQYKKQQEIYAEGEKRRFPVVGHLRERKAEHVGWSPTRKERNVGVLLSTSNTRYYTNIIRKLFYQEYYCLIESESHISEFIIIHSQHFLLDAFYIIFYQHTGTIRTLKRKTSLAKKQKFSNCF